MKKITICFLLSFLVLTSYSAITGSPGGEIDHPIVGKWEYEKTILPDGSEVIDLVAREHYYADGTLLYVNVWLTPQPVDEFSNTPEEISNSFKLGVGAIATYKIEKGKEKDKLHYKVVASTKAENTGNSVSVEIKVEKDTIIFYLKNGKQVILKRVKDS
jgi:hypothetical protein